MSGLVSVITPTHERHDLLLRAIRSVDAQEYRPIEHIVVSDGPDAAVRQLDGYGGFVRVIELGRNWHSISGGWGAEARMAGTLLARGDFIAYLDDDNALLPHHVSELVALIERDGVDFAHGQMIRARDGSQFGNGQIRVGSVDCGMVLHRAECLRFGHWRPNREDGYVSDGALYESWVENGATHSYLPRPTFIYGAEEG